MPTTSAEIVELKNEIDATFTNSIKLRTQMSRLAEFQIALCIALELVVAELDKLAPTPNVCTAATILGVEVQKTIPDEVDRIDRNPS